LVLPGLCGSIKGTGHALQALFASGVRPAVLHARGCGHDLTSACFNLFGSTDDVRAAIGRVKDLYPGARVGLYGISAGTALLVRYLGEEGSRTPVVAAVAHCPGYDIGVCLTRVGWIYDCGFYLGVLKRHWLGGRNGELLRVRNPEACRRMQSATDMHAFQVAASPFAAPEAEGAPPRAPAVSMASAPATAPAARRDDAARACSSGAGGGAGGGGSCGGGGRGGFGCGAGGEGSGKALPVASGAWLVEVPRARAEDAAGARAGARAARVTAGATRSGGASGGGGTGAILSSTLSAT
jgi:hypothetical protein